MQSLRDLQVRFIDFLTEGGVDRVPMIQADSSEECLLRLNIYKNAYRTRLRQVIESDHEILWTYLGDEMFEQLVSGYIASHPSNFTSLRNYCNQLPDYLANTEPFDQHPIIAEIASFERLLMDAFDAGEADRVGLPELRSLTPDDWPSMRLRFHPSVQMLAADWNSVESWKALKGDDQPPPANKDATRYWLLWRGTDRLSKFRSVEKNEHAMLTQAITGESFSTLCEALLRWHDADQASVTGLQHITSWLEDGLIISIKDTQPR